MSSSPTIVTIQLTASIPPLTLIASTGTFDPAPPETIASGSVISFAGASPGGVTYANREYLLTLKITFSCMSPYNEATVDLEAEEFSIGHFMADWFGLAVSGDDPQGQFWLPFAVPQFGQPMQLYVGVRLLTEPPMQPPAGQIL